MRLFLAVLGLILLVGPARADDRVVERMEGWWGGMKAADIMLTVDESSRSAGPINWDGMLEIHSSGIIKWLTGLTAEARGHGHFSSPPAVSESYLQHVRSNKSDRTVSVAYAGDTSLATRTKDLETFADPTKAARDAENVPDLPEDERRGTIDPIAAVLSIGRRAAAGEKRFVLAVYDGRRRFDLAVEVTGPGSHHFDGRQVATLDAIATVHPIGGFKPFHVKWWNNAKFDVFVDPRTELPLQISSSSFVAAVVVTAHAVCPPNPDCAFPSNK
jgi:hypothetical protein